MTYLLTIFCMLIVSLTFFLLDHTVLSKLANIGLDLKSALKDNIKLIAALDL